MLTNMYYLGQWSPTFLAPGTGFVGRQFFHGMGRGGGGWGGGEDGSGGNASDGGRWGAANEASLAHRPLTSCCVARFLTGHGPGVRDP